MRRPRVSKEIRTMAEEYFIRHPGVFGHISDRVAAKARREEIFQGAKERGRRRAEEMMARQERNAELAGILQTVPHD